MEITETTIVAFSLSQFLTIMIFVISQTAFIVGVYWKLNKRSDGIEKAVDLDRSNSNSQYEMLDRAISAHEDKFQEKCIVIERESEIRYKGFDKTLELTNETLKELNLTVQQLSKLVIDIRGEFGEHKAFHKGKESAE